MCEAGRNFALDSTVSNYAGRFKQRYDQVRMS